MAGLVKRALAIGLATAMWLSPVRGLHAAPPPDPKADPTPADIEQARSLFNNGQDLYADGEYEAAIAAFRRAYQLSGEPNCLYNIALALERMEDFGEAAAYLKYYRAYRPADEQEALQAKVAELEDKQRELDAIDAAQAEPEPDDEPPPPRPTPPTDDGPKPPIFGPAAIATASVAVAAFGIATGLGVTSLRRKDVAASACGLDPDGDRFCPAGAAPALHDSRRFALGADISIGIGAAAAVATIVIVAVAASRRNAPGRVALQPTGISLRF